MAFRNECAVCHKKFISALNPNWIKFYNDAIVQLDHSPRNVDRELIPSGGFVCKECATNVATVTCGCGLCEATQVYKRYNANDLNGINREMLSQDIKDKEKLEKLLRACGCDLEAKQVAAYPYWVCEKCTNEFVRKAALTVKSAAKISADDLFLKVPIKHESSVCSRCGKRVKEDYRDVLLRLYDDAKFVWGNRGKEVPIGFTSDLYRSNMWSCIHETAMTFLSGGCICKDCVPYLLPENVNLYLQNKIRWGWQGEIAPKDLSVVNVKYPIEVSAEVGGYSYVGNEQRRKRQESADRELKSMLEMPAICMGANAFIGYHSEWNGERYSAGATPVVVGKSKMAGVVVDGSNVIRADGGPHVDGLFALVQEATKRQSPAKVFLDANIIHVLKDSGNNAESSKLEKAIKSNSDTYVPVPAGSRADDFILQYANRTGAKVVSNDRYEPYVERYPWIKEGRVARFMFSDHRLLIPDLDIDIAE